MFTLELNVDDIALIVTKLICYFVKCYDELYPNKRKCKKKIIQIQILTESRGSFYRLQVVYCGKRNFSVQHLVNEIFDEIAAKFHAKQIMLGTVYSKNATTEFNNEQNEQILYVSNKIILINKNIHTSSVRTYWNEYTCISLKNKIQECDFAKFEEQINNCLTEKKLNYPKIRFVFMKDGHQIMKDSLDPEISSCHAIASAMAAIVKNSRNEEFRKKMLDTWHVSTAGEMNKHIFQTLMEHLENKIKD